MMDVRKYRETLLMAIENRAKCGAVFLHSQPIKLSMDGKVVWKGKVEVFQLKGHAEAKLAFGWGFQNNENKMEYVTVIGVSPLDDPMSAVKAYFATRKKSRS